MNETKKRLGAVAATAVVLGNIVGVMIFLTQGSVAKHLPWDGWLLAAWALGGVLALLGSLCMAELGAMMPEAGGDYIYIREAFGERWAFLSGWTSIAITFPGSIAAMAVALCKFQISSWLGAWVNQAILSFALGSWSFSITWAQLMGIGLLLVLTWINVRGLGLSGHMQTVLTVLPLLLVMLAAVVSLFVTPSGTPPAAIDTSKMSPLSGLWPAIVLVFFAYAGWNATTYIGGEIKDPGRNLPLSLIVGTLLAMVVYLVITMMFLKAVPAASMPNAKPMVPFVALERLFGGWAGQGLNVVIALAVTGSLNATVMVGARISYAMAGHGLAFRGLHSRHPKTGTPARALWLQAFVASVLVLSGQFDALISYVSAVMLLFSSLAVGALLMLRRKLPTRERPYKVWLYPLTPLLYIGFSLSVVVGLCFQSPWEVIIGIVITALGVPAYLWVSRR